MSTMSDDRQDSLVFLSIERYIIYILEKINLNKVAKQWSNIK